MRFGNAFIQSWGITLLIALLVILPPVSGLAASSHPAPEESSEMSQEMEMDNEVHEKEEPAGHGAEEKDLPETTEDGHEPADGEAESGHGESGGHGEGTQEVNWPVIWSFAGVNGAVLLTAAVLRRKKLHAAGVNQNVGS